jgi:hypothetical protein
MSGGSTVFCHGPRAETKGGFPAKKADAPSRTSSVELFDLQFSKWEHPGTLPGCATFMFTTQFQLGPSKRKVESEF